MKALGSVASAVATAENDVDFFAGEALAGEAGFEADLVVDEDDVVDEEVGEFEVADGGGVAQADGVERDALGAGELGGAGQGFALGGLAVGEQEDGGGRSASEFGEDFANGVSQAGLGAGGLGAFEGFEGGGDLVGLVDLGQEAGGVRDEVEAELVLGLELAEEAGFVAGEPALGQGEPGRLGLAGGLGQGAGGGGGFGVGVGVFDGGAGGVVDHDDERGQARALDGENGFGEHEHGQEDERDAKGGQQAAVPGGAGCLSPVEADDEEGGGGEEGQGQALGPGLLEPDAGDEGFARAGGLDQEAGEPGGDLAIEPGGAGFVGRDGACRRRTRPDQ